MKCDTDKNVLDSQHTDRLMPKDIQEDFNTKRIPSDGDLPEYKLEINTEALKNLKLRRTRVRNFENTILVMGNDTSKAEVSSDEGQDNCKLNSNNTTSDAKTNSEVNSYSGEEVKSVANCSQSKLGSFSKSDIISSGSSHYNTTKSDLHITPGSKLEEIVKTDKIDKEVAINDTANITHLATFQEYMKNVNHTNATVANIQTIDISEMSAANTESIAETDMVETDLQNPVSDAYSSSFTGVDSATLPSLKRPSVVLKSPRRLPKSNYNNVIKEATHREINISLRNNDHAVQDSKVCSLISNMYLC